MSWCLFCGRRPWEIIYPPLQMKYHHCEHLRMCLFVCPYVLNHMKGLMIQHPNKVRPELVLLKTKVNNDQNLNYLFAFGEILIISVTFIERFVHLPQVS